MSLRALWVISHEKGEHVAVRFSRRFPTVEYRAKSLAGASYQAVPEDSAVLRLLLTELGLADPDKPYVAHRDDCLSQQRTPALELRVDSSSAKGVLWPVLAISQGPLILACLPLVDASGESRPPLTSLLSVSQGLTLLDGLQHFLSKTDGDGGGGGGGGLASRLALMPSVMQQVCPLGTPLDVPRAPSATAVPAPAGRQRQPAWRTGHHRGRALVNVALTEVVRCMQYGDPSRQDLWDVYGTCEVEGVLPSVTVTLSLPPNGSPLQDVLAHPCVTSLDSSIVSASSVPVPPILGSYQLKEENNQLRVFVSLKLHESVKNTFDYCEARLPFFNRDQISSVEVKVSAGHLDVNKEKNLLVWVLGQKFPKSREVTMEGGIRFLGQLPGPVDTLCTDLTAYLKLYFKVPDLTLSGCSVDQHSVQVYSCAKPKILTCRELQSKDYFIWNSTGPAPVSPGRMML
ncbi:hypothetical protein CRUP_033153 [Coryphaenoides rupestris]|nr:hypothetical protein CRUP_033153 [Coryphaenoides rupestris]